MGWMLGQAVAGGAALALAGMRASRHRDEFGAAGGGLTTIALVAGLALVATAAVPLVGGIVREGLLFGRATLVVATILGIVLVIGELTGRRVPAWLLVPLVALGLVRLLLWLTTDLVYVSGRGPDGWPVYGTGHVWTAALSFPFVVAWVVMTLRDWDDRFERRALLLALVGTMAVGLVATFATGFARQVGTGGLGLPLVVGIAAVDRHRTRALAASHARADADRGRLADELRAALAVREDLLDAVTHELRTPLTPIQGHTEVLRTRYRGMDSSSIELSLEAIQRNSERLTRVVDEIMAAGHLRPDVHRPSEGDLDLHDLLEEAVRDGIPGEVEVSCPPGLRTTAARSHLEHVLHRLLANAVVHGRPPVRVVAEDTGTALEVRVHDAGPGIPPDFRERAFEPFTQASRGATRATGGVGLGLFTARRLAEAMGGTLTLGDRPAELVLRLPRSLVVDVTEPAVRRGAAGGA